MRDHVAVTLLAFVRVTFRSYSARVGWESLSSIVIETPLGARNAADLSGPHAVQKAASAMATRRDPNGPCNRVVAEGPVTLIELRKFYPSKLNQSNTALKYSG